MIMKLEEGEVLIKEDNTDIVEASVGLSVDYTFKEKRSSKDPPTFTWLGYVTISTENQGGGNYFRIFIKGDEDNDNKEEGLAVTSLDEIIEVIEDFKKRYKLATQTFKTKK
jgi:hypothetical protein